MPLVFQYGSNCKTSEINRKKRLDGRATDHGRARTTEEFEIAFNKWSQGRGCAAADLTRPESGGRRIWGVLYKVSGRDLIRIAQDIEGASYEPKEIKVEDAAGDVKTATTFVVKADRRHDGLWTSAEYVGHIVNGLHDHDVPEEYIQHVIEVAIETNRRAGEKAQEQSDLIAALFEPPSW